MDYEDNDARDQNLNVVGESSSKVSSALHSYTLPKFDFDDSLQGHLRFDSLVENEVFLGITSQEDNQWIEEYSCGTSAVESTRKDVWSEATSSESVAMLLKSVGQEEKVLEPGSLTNVIDSNFKDNFVASKMSSECEQSQETQISGVDVDSLVIADKCKSPVGEDTVDKICDDVNQEASETVNQSSLQEDPSVTVVEGGKDGSSPNIDASPQELVNNSSVIENVSDHIIKSNENIVEKLSVDSNVESLAVEDTNTESKILESRVQSHSVEETEIGGGSDINNAGKTSITAECSTEISAEDISHKDAAPENSAVKAHTGDSNDETQSLEPDDNTMDQDVTLSKTVDTVLPLDYRDMDLDVVAASDSQKNVEPSLSVEGCGVVVAMADGSESNLTVPTDFVAAVDSSEISCPIQSNVVPLTSATVLTADNVTEDQPISPILGVRNEKEVPTPEVDNTLDSTSGDPLLVVEKDSVSDGPDKVVNDNHCDPNVENLNVGSSEQTAEENPDGSSAKGCTNAEEEVQLNPKESISGEHGAAPQNLAVSMSDAQPASVDVAVAVIGPSELDTDHVVQKGGGSSPLDKPHMFSLSDTKSIELFKVAKDKFEIAPVPKFSDDGTGHQSVSSSSVTKEDKSFTFEVNASAPGQTVLQTISFSENVKVSSVNPSGSLLDPIKLHEDCLVSPQTPSSAATEAGPKEKSERKPRKKPVGRETANKGSHLKETPSAKRSRKVEKSPPLLTPPTTGHASPDKKLMPNESVECSNTPINTSHLPDLNNSTHLFTDAQQVQLRAQILVYGSLLSGMPPEEAHMITSFGHSDGGRRAWEAAWQACLERVRGHKSQPSNPTLSTPDQGTKSASIQSKILSGAPSPIVSPMIPISSPLWNISTPCDGSQSNALARNALFDYRQTLSPLHLYQSPQVQNFGGHNPMWLSQGPSPGHWAASSPVPRFSALPITESVKLTTVKESCAPSIPVKNVNPSTGPIVSSSQHSSDSKSRKRKKAAATEGYNQISFLAQNQTKSGTAVVTPVVLSTPISINTKSNSENLPSASGRGDQNILKPESREEITAKVDESKLQAADASVHAAAAVTHCQDLWNQLEKQMNLGLLSDAEAKLASSAVSVAAASSVAKVAAAAAKVASNVAEQARLMAEEVVQSSRTKNNNQSSMTSPDKAASVISAARDAVRRRIEAASAASKHAENLDAILKAAELAAEAVLQAGKIVAMGNPLSLRVLVEAGPEGFWKTPESSNANVEPTNNKGIQTLKHSLSLQEDSVDLAKNKMIIDADGIPGSVAINDNVIPESEFGSVPTSDANQNMRQSTSNAWKDNIIKEGCLVEVCKESNKKKGAWFAANVLALKDGKAFVCYTEIQSDEDSGKLKEWVPVEVDGTEAPMIRVAHPMTTLGSEGAKKRGRTALTDYTWGSGDRVDVWVHNCWCEAVVMATNKIDVTSLTVQFIAQGDTAIVRTWHVRPTLIWKDHKWIEWSSLKESRSSEGDTPHHKRQKFGTSVVEGKEKDIPSNSVNLVESGRNQESRLPLSAQGSLFSVGKSSINEKKLDTRRAMKPGLQKERSRVVFGVPRPGKKQKFMDVSTQYVANVSNKNSTTNDSAKLNSQIMPQAQGSRGSKNDYKSDGKEKQAVEFKSKALKPRKPPVPSFRSLAQKDKLKPSKTASHDSVSVDENMAGSSSNTEDAKETSTSKGVSQRLNKGKIAARGDRNATKVEVKEKSTSESEIRRSNRRIQPTSRLLEGLQSSLSLAKTPSASNASQRSHNKLTPKVSSNSS